MIVCVTSPQINDFCDLLGTYAPVSKIAPVKEALKRAFFLLAYLAHARNEKVRRIGIRSYVFVLRKELM